MHYTAAIDVVVDPTPDNVAASPRALRALVRYGTLEDCVIDITGHIGDAFRFADIEGESMALAGVAARVAAARMLYRMRLFRSKRPRADR